MDDSVLKALAKWPNVPDVFNWLGLDRRGNWLLKNTPIGNPAITEFINRNYASDSSGRWYFQNGPQKVYSSLAYTPFVLRLGADTQRDALMTHTGDKIGGPLHAWMDENGDLLFAWSSGIGLLCDRDLPLVVPCITDKSGRLLTDEELEIAVSSYTPEYQFWLNLRTTRLPVERILSKDVATRFGFNPDPQPAPGQADC